MPAACIALVAGAAVVVLPTPTITLAWMHTVEKTRWEEDYLASTAGVAITEARIEAIDAGMEPPASAIREGRWWRYKPSLRSAEHTSELQSLMRIPYAVFCLTKK